MGTTDSSEFKQAAAKSGTGGIKVVEGLQWCSEEGERAQSANEHHPNTQRAAPAHHVVDFELDS